MHKLLIMSLFLAAAFPARAQEAVKDLDGHRFCNADGVDLRETGDGGYKVDIVTSGVGDAAAAVYPAGGARLFAQHAELKPYISINYEFLLDAAGNPRSRPAPVRMSVSTGRFAGPRLEPMESLTLWVRAGDVASSPIGINSAFYNIALVAGEVGLPGSSNPYDTEWSETELGKVVMAVESKERWVMLSKDGQEVARIPVPQQSLVEIREKAVAWIRKTVPLLKQGRCG